MLHEPLSWIVLWRLLVLAATAAAGWILGGAVVKVLFERLLRMLK